MRKSFFLHFVKVFIISLLVCGCSAEYEMSHTTNRKISRSKITLADFQSETGIKNFSTRIKLNLPQSIARTSDGGYELSDFNISTEAIKRLELDESITYSFRINPVIATTTGNFYNLTLHSLEGQWIEEIIEFEPTLASLNKVLSGEDGNVDGNATLIYSSDSTVVNSNGCYPISIVNSKCTDEEMSCYEEKFATFCLNGDGFLIGNSSDIQVNTPQQGTNYSFILNTNEIKDAAKLYADKQILLTEKIGALILAEEGINFSDFPFEALESSRSESELKSYFENAGITKSDELIALLKEEVENFNTFVNENLDYKMLDPSYRNIVMSNGFNLLLDELEPINVENGRTCWQKYEKAYGRCYRNYAYSASLSLAAVIPSGGWALLGVAGSMIVLNNCLSDAYEDYQECRESE